MPPTSANRAMTNRVAPHTVRNLGHQRLLSCGGYKWGGKTTLTRYTLLGDERDDETATTANLTELVEDNSSVESDNKEAAEDFVVENQPCTLPEKTLLGGDGELERRRKKERIKREWNKMVQETMSGA